MAKRLNKFTDAFQNSRIPFLLAEVITDGQGAMVDLVCRFANEAAAALLQMPVESLQGQRFTRAMPAQRMAALKALEAVAFSGSTVSFSYDTSLGQTLSITCYQPVYGAVCCILDPVRGSARGAGVFPETFPGATAVIELSRSGVRCLSFNQQLCDLAGWTRSELLNQFAEDFSAMVEPSDWPDLLQELLDAARDSRPVDTEFRLRRREGTSLWVELRADILPRRKGVSVIHALLLDIDRRRRGQEQLSAEHRQSSAAQQQLSELFDTLPDGYCLFRRTSETASLVPLQISQGASQLLDCSIRELTRQLTADPLWPVAPEERESLSAAAAQARSSGTPLQQTCRLQRGDGGTVWAFLELVWRPQQDGSELLYAVCFDRTAEMESQAELRFRSQLCDLLLDRSRILSIDYDPATDVIRIERHNSTGHRTIHTIANYLPSLDGTTFIHPDDRKALFDAVTRLSARSGAETMEYRGNYDGQGWRWYRLSLISLFDSKGNVTRLIGKGEDVSQAKAAAQRFRTLVARQETLLPGVLASARLDLAADRILDAKGGSGHLVRVLFGNTADACLRHLRDNVPDPEQRRQFDALFRRDTLLAAFHQGETAFSLEHRFLSGDGAPIWVKTTLELAEEPDTLHITAFCTISNIDDLRYQDAVLGTLVRRGYEYVLTVNAASGVCRMYGGREPLPAGTTYQMLLTRYLRELPPSPQRTAVRRAAGLQTILGQLEEQAIYEYACTLDTPHGPRSKRLCCSWLDREAGVLLLTLEHL